MFLTALLVLGIVGDSGPPDVKGFTPILSKELEFRIDDCKTGFLGRVVDYQNPNDINEFVRVYYRQVAIVSERACENNSSERGGLERNSSNLNYHQKEEADTLGRVQKATDAFAYIQWRTIRDPRTGYDIQEEFFQIWLLDPSGGWVYNTQPPGTKSDLDSSPFSELSKNNPKNRINVGIKFYLADTVHIVRVDQDDILTLKREATNDKK